MKQKSIAAVTLGCKVNYAETSSIIDMLVSRGWRLTEIVNGADLVIVHTCAVTGEAERKSRQQVRKIIRNHPSSRVVVIGCYSQLDPERLMAIDGVSFVLGSKEKFDISLYELDADSADCSSRIKVSPAGELNTAHVASSMLSQPEKGRTRAFLKIQDGCSFGCAYCTIPMARGRSRSVPFETVIDRACRIAEAGYREIVLTGINIADYRDGNIRFSELLWRLEAVNVGRLRISSVEPELLDDDIIEIVAASGKIMPHFHLPLQSGSDRVLLAMGRHYDTAFYRERLMKAVTSIPDCAIGIDVMVGYPGETDQDFEAMCRFIEELPVAYLHVFTCSVRPGTRLFREVTEKQRSRIHPAEAALRAARLGAIGQRSERRFAKAFTGRRLRVLFEERSTDADGKTVWSGYSGNYLRVQVGIEADAETMKGREHEVLIEGFGEGLQLQGRLLS